MVIGYNSFNSILERNNIQQRDIRNMDEHGNCSTCVHQQNSPELHIVNSSESTNQTPPSSNQEGYLTHLRKQR
jgi:hypothetical protein